MDAILHQERLRGREKRVHALAEPIEHLPDGAMITAMGNAWLIAAGRAFRWSPSGYEPSTMPSVVDGLLTPPSTLAALKAGYRPILHSSCVE